MVKEAFYQNAFFKIPILAVAGGFGFLAYPPYSHIVAIALMLGVWFFYLNHTTNAWTAFKDAFILGGFFGLFSTSWITHAFEVNELSRFCAGAIGVYFGMILIFGTFFAVPAVLTIKLKLQTGSERLMAFMGLFVILEWVRSWIFTGFPWNLMGNIWTFSPPMMQSASFFGVYGLSLMTLLFCTLGLLPNIKPLLWAVVILGLNFGMGYWRLYKATDTDVLGVRLRLVQPNTPQTHKWNDRLEDENLTRLIHLSRKDNKGITHVLWPETAVSFMLELDEVRRSRLIAAVNQGGTVITGGLRITGPMPANSIFVIDGDTAKILDFYDKKHLVPFGEYVPAPFKKIPFLDKIVPLPADISPRIGRRRNTYVPKAPPVSMIICYEAIFSGDVAIKSPRSQWIFIATNDAWYGLSDGPYQHLGMAQLRATEEGLPVIRVANSGISAVIDPYGRILGALPLGRSGYLDAPLPVALTAPFYACYGVKVPLFICILLLVFALWDKNVVRRKYGLLDIPVEGKK